MGTLVLCSGCSRHVRANEAACPFCGSRLEAVPARRFAPIGTGASRSRRYALRAAILAGSATASCSQSTGTAQGTGGAGVLDASSSGGAGAQGGANPGGVTSQGGASGATAGRAGNGGTGNGGTGNGGAGNGGTGNGGAGNGGANGGGAGNGGVGGALVPGRACPGFTDGDPGRVCRSPTECPPRPGYTTLCTNALQRIPCFRSELYPIAECSPTVPCPQDWSCVNVLCDVWTCVLGAPCTDQNCHGDRHCVDGTCVVTPCYEPGGQKCPAGFECNPDAQPGQLWCRPARCTDGYVCPPPLTCGAPTPNQQGCGGITCEQDDDCPCGYCVSRQCAPQLGVCDYQILQMPYGCVWPDEELV